MPPAGWRRRGGYPGRRLRRAEAGESTGRNTGRRRRGDTRAGRRRPTPRKTGCRWSGPRPPGRPGKRAKRQGADARNATHEGLLCVRWPGRGVPAAWTPTLSFGRPPGAGHGRRARTGVFPFVCIVTISGPMTTWGSPATAGLQSPRQVLRLIMARRPNLAGPGARTCPNASFMPPPGNTPPCSWRTPRTCPGPCWRACSGAFRRGPGGRERVEALAMYGRHRPDMVAAKVRLPGLDGAGLAMTVAGIDPGSRFFSWAPRRRSPPCSPTLSLPSVRFVPTPADPERLMGFSRTRPGWGPAPSSRESERLVRFFWTPRPIPRPFFQKRLEYVNRRLLMFMGLRVLPRVPASGLDSGIFCATARPPWPIRSVSPGRSWTTPWTGNTSWPSGIRAIRNAPPTCSRSRPRDCRIRNGSCSP